MRRSSLPVIAILVLFAGCGDLALPTGNAPELPQFAIRDGAHGGNEHFFFLPPLVPNPSPTGEFDATQSPRVEICEWSSEQCLLPLTAAFAMTGGSGSEVVRLEAADQHYHVNWHTNDFPLVDGRTYRIRVLVVDTELGFADVQVFATSKAAKNLKTGETFALVDGRTLPIKFRIEKNAVFVLDPDATEPQTIETPPAANGSTVKLVLEPASLSAPAAVTVEQIENELTNPKLVSGLAYEFGPEGTTFEKAASVTMGYTEASLPAGVDESTLKMYWTEKLPSGRVVWKELATSKVDVVANTVTAEVTHFSGGAIGQASVSPQVDTILQGEVVLLAATFYDDTGAEIPAANVSWTSSAPWIAAVDDTGQVRGDSIGTATITAQAIDPATGEVLSEGTSSITVVPAPYIASIVISPSDTSIALGTAGYLTARAWLNTGEEVTLDQTTVTWFVPLSDTAMVTVMPDTVTNGASAYAFGNWPGTATVIAQANSGVSASAQVKVTRGAVVTLTPSPLTVTVGAGELIAANVVDTWGAPVAPASTAWSTSDPTRAWLADSVGWAVVNGIAPGVVTVTVVTDEGLTASTQVTITDIASIEMSPTEATLAPNAFVDVTATPLDIGGNALTGKTIAWSTSDASVATVDANGRVTAVAAGTAEITATSETRSGTVVISVGP